MKIIAGNYYGKNIQFVCKRCNCVYEVESKDDWTIDYVYPDYWGNKMMVPNYSITCPNCGYNEHLGYDPEDLAGTNAENTFCPWIPLLSNRDDWKERYKVGIKDMIKGE